MGTLKTVLIATLFAFIFSATFSYGADATKIGVIDFQKILETSSAGKASQAEINRQGKAMELDLKKVQADLEELKKKLDREALVMSKEMREEKERDFRIKVNDLRTLENKYKKDINELNKRLVRRMQDEVFNLVEELGKKEGYTLIVERTEGGVVYRPNAVDLTDELIRLYNARYAQSVDKTRKKDKK